MRVLGFLHPLAINVPLRILSLTMHQKVVEACVSSTKFLTKSTGIAREQN
jgi:hypothetical protein